MAAMAYPPPLEPLRNGVLHLIRTDGRDLSVRQLGLLLHVVKITDPAELGKVVTIRGAAEALGTSKPAMTRAADSLSAAGLLLRKADPQDGRSVLLVLTAQGKAYVTKLASAVAT